MTKQENLRIMQLEEMLRDAMVKNDRMEKALEDVIIQRAHEYAVATGCTVEEAFAYANQLQEEAKRHRMGLGKQAEMKSGN